MKLGQVFRELIREEGVDFDEASAWRADMAVPEALMRDIPDDQVAAYKDGLREYVRWLMKLPQSEIDKHARKHQERN